ncbi:hypothetical protein B0H12DRAFT_695717 [Mycena haematopus]|nr:hypothetical protein B0H12DRAFT_695717 [Mycena haematopus]
MAMTFQFIFSALFRKDRDTEFNCAVSFYSSRLPTYIKVQACRGGNVGASAKTSVILLNMFLVILVLLASMALAYLSWSPTFQQRPVETGKSIPCLKGFPIFGCTGFFNRRNEFIQETLQLIGDNLCEIHLPNCRVILTQGVEAQWAFFNEKALSLEFGYLILHPPVSVGRRRLEGGPRDAFDFRGRPTLMVSSPIRRFDA